jgi:hypothetical protein
MFHLHDGMTLERETLATLAPRFGCANAVRAQATLARRLCEWLSGSEADERHLGAVRIAHGGV